MGKVEQRVDFPACPFVLLEFPIVKREEGVVLWEEDGYPKQKSTKPSGPQWIALAHMRLKDPSVMRAIAKKVSSATLERLAFE